MWIGDMDGDLLNLKRFDAVVLNNSEGGQMYSVTAHDNGEGYEVLLFRGSKQDSIAYMKALGRHLGVIALEEQRRV